MRLILSIILLCSNVCLFAQIDSVKNLPCANREFSVLAHVFQRKNGDLGITQNQIQNAINSLNRAFEPICVSFRLCDTKTYWNYNFNVWSDVGNREDAIGLYHKSRHINVFLVDSIADPFDAGGYATLAGIKSFATPFVTIEKESGPTVWIHEFGHYFGLLHTFETGNGAELVNGSNCQAAGDGICDTPADPYPNSAVTASPECKFSSSAKDANGQTYLPMIENFMSYYFDCVCRFSRQQYFKMYENYISSPEAH